MEIDIPQTLKNQNVRDSGGKFSTLDGSFYTDQSQGNGNDYHTNLNKMDPILKSQNSEVKNYEESQATRPATQVYGSRHHHKKHHSNQIMPSQNYQHALHNTSSSSENLINGFVVPKHFLPPQTAASLFQQSPFVQQNVTAVQHGSTIQLNYVKMRQKTAQNTYNSHPSQSQSGQNLPPNLNNLNNGIQVAPRTRVYRHNRQKSENLTSHKNIFRDRYPTASNAKSSQLKLQSHYNRSQQATDMNTFNQEQPYVVAVNGTATAVASQSEASIRDSILGVRLAPRVSVSDFATQSLNDFKYANSKNGTIQMHPFQNQRLNNTQALLQSTTHQIVASKQLQDSKRSLEASSSMVSSQWPSLIPTPNDFVKKDYQSTKGSTQKINQTQHGSFHTQQVSNFCQKIKKGAKVQQNLENQEVYRRTRQAKSDKFLLPKQRAQTVEGNNRKKRFRQKNQTTTNQIWAKPSSQNLERTQKSVMLKSTLSGTEKAIQASVDKFQNQLKEQDFVDSEQASQKGCNFSTHFYEKQNAIAQNRSASELNTSHQRSYSAIKMNQRILFAKDHVQQESATKLSIIKTYGLDRKDNDSAQKVHKNDYKANLEQAQSTQKILENLQRQDYYPKEKQVQILRHSDRQIPTNFAKKTSKTSINSQNYQLRPINHSISILKKKPAGQTKREKIKNSFLAKLYKKIDEERAAKVKQIMDNFDEETRARLAKEMAESELQARSKDTHQQEGGGGVKKDQYEEFAKTLFKKLDSKKRRDERLKLQKMVRAVFSAHYDTESIFKRVETIVDKEEQKDRVGDDNYDDGQASDDNCDVISRDDNRDEIQETRQLIEDKIKIAQGLKEQRDNLADSKTRSDQKKIALLQQILTAHTHLDDISDLGEAAAEKANEENESLKASSFTESSSEAFSGENDHDDFDDGLRLGEDIIDELEEIDVQNVEVTDYYHQQQQHVEEPKTASINIQKRNRLKSLDSSNNTKKSLKHMKSMQSKQDLNTGASPTLDPMKKKNSVLRRMSQFFEQQSLKPKTSSNLLSQFSEDLPKLKLMDKFKKSGVSKKMFSREMADKNISEFEENIFTGKALPKGMIQRQSTFGHKQTGDLQEIITEGKSGQMSSEAAELVQEKIKKLKFNELSKASNTMSSVAEVFEKDPILIYQKVFSDAAEIMLPLIIKVKFDSLILQDYTLSENQCQGLANAISQVGLPKIKILYLDNCGVDDGECAILLEGLVKLDCFHSFVYKNNVFADEALEALQPILLKPKGTNLRVIKFVNCNCSGAIMDEFLEFLIDNGIRLEDLSLVQMNLSGSSVEFLSEYILTNYSLETLDISWNNLRANNFTPLLTALAKNRYLKNINLSWNVVVDTSDQHNEIEMRMLDRGERMDNERRRMEQAYTSPSQHIVDCLSDILRYNTSLQHLDLTFCGLSQEILVLLLPALRRAKSLLSFHLGQNPGLSKELIDFWTTQLHCKREEPQVHLKVRPVKQKPLTELQKQSLTGDENKQYMLKMEKYESRVTEERAKNIFNKDMAKVKRFNEVEIKMGGLDLLITRKLNHKIDLPGEAQWVLSEFSNESHCFVCNHSIYTLIFWNEQIGAYNELTALGISSKEKQRLVDHIRQNNFKGMHGRPDVPALFSNQTNWKGKPFIKFGEFLLKLTGGMPCFKEKIEEEAKAIFEVVSLQNVENKDQLHKFTIKRRHELEQQHTEQLYEQHAQILRQNSVYSQPKLINYDLMTSPGQTYVLPIFLPPIQIDWLIRTPADLHAEYDIRTESIKIEDYQTIQDVKFRFYYNRHVINLREEKIPRFSKILKKVDRATNFVKEASVFAPWTSDSQSTYQKCIAHDIKYWKCPKFVKDENDLNQCIKIFLDNMGPIKEIFLGIVANGADPPDIKQLDFLDFCTTSGIIDKNVTMSIIDVYFTATNFEEEDQGGNDDRALIRFEFLEIIVRIVRGKYMEKNKVCSTYAEGVQKLLTEHILPFRSQVLPWQAFRDKHLWTFGVNELLQANFSNLEQVYANMIKSKRISHPVKTARTKKLVEYEEAIDYMVAVLGKIGVNSKMANQAFILSKMSIPDENNVGPDEYDCLRFVEFLEYIGRLSYYVNQGDVTQTNVKLEKKIEPILVILFKEIKQFIVDPNDMNQMESESDNDY